MSAIAELTGRYIPRPRSRRTRPPRLEVGGIPLGGLLALARDRIWLLEQAATVRGGICELSLGVGPVVIVSSPELAYEVLVGRADSFVKGSSYDLLRPTIGTGLLTSEGNFHRRQRRLMGPAFRHRRVAS